MRASKCRYIYTLYPTLKCTFTKHVAQRKPWMGASQTSRGLNHYNDAIMTTMASQITSLTVVYSTACSDADQRKHKVPRHWPLCGEYTGTGEFPAERASYAENVSIWWRHHDYNKTAHTFPSAASINRRYYCKKGKRGKSSWGSIIVKHLLTVCP